MKKVIFKSLTLSSFILGLSNAHAGGFQLFEESASSMGTAFAGSGVAADASSAFYNPAAMTLLERPELSFTGTAIDIGIKAHVTAAMNSGQADVPLLSGTPITEVPSGNPDANPGSTQFVPAFEFVYPYQNLAFGFSVTAPFDLSTKYDDDSMLRFMATDSRLTMVDLSPSVALRINPKFSVGLGLDAAYIQTRLDQEVFIVPPLSTKGYEGSLHNEGQDWGYGWHAGLLYQFTPQTRAGLTYHSRMSFTVKGDASLNGVDLPPLLAPVIDQSGQVSAAFTLPDWVDLSVSHDFNSKWTGLASLDYTHWSLIQNVVLNYSGNIAKVIQRGMLTLDFKDTVRLALGAAYHANQKWTFRGGVAFDPSPVRNDETRTFRLPDNDRYWLALGANYKATEHLSFDLGFAHLFVPNYSNSNTQIFDEALITNLGPIIPYSSTNYAAADFKSQVNEIGLQVNYRF